MVTNINEYSDNIASKVDHEIMVANSGRAIPVISHSNGEFKSGVMGNMEGGTPKSKATKRNPRS